MVDLVEDREGFAPGVARRTMVTGSVIGVADPAKRVGLEGPVAELPEQVQGVPVAGDGALGVAQAMAGVAEAVPGQRLSDAVVDLLEQDQRPLAGGQGPSLIADQGVGPPDRPAGGRRPAPTSPCHSPSACSNSAAASSSSPGHVARQRVARALREPVGPHPVEERPDRHHPVGLYQKGSQHAPLPEVTDVDDPTVDPHRYITQQAEPHPHESLQRSGTFPEGCSENPD